MKSLKVLSQLVTFLTLSIIYTSSQAQGNGSSPNGKPFVAIGDQIIEVQGAVSSIQDQIDALVSRLDYIEDGLERNVAAIQVLEQVNAQLSLIISSNQNDIDSINSIINDIQTDISEIDTELDSLAITDETLQSELVLLTTLLQSLQQSLLDTEVNLQKQIDANTHAIADLNFEIEILQQQLKLKQNLISGTCDEGQAVISIQDDSLVCASTQQTGNEFFEVRTFQKIDATNQTRNLQDLRCPNSGMAGTVISAAAEDLLRWRVEQTYPKGDGQWRIYLRRNLDYLYVSGRWEYPSYRFQCLYPKVASEVVRD